MTEISEGSLKHTASVMPFMLHVLEIDVYMCTSKKVHQLYFVIT